MLGKTSKAACGRSNNSYIVHLYGLFLCPVPFRVILRIVLTLSSCLVDGVTLLWRFSFEPCIDAIQPSNFANSCCIAAYCHDLQSLCGGKTPAETIARLSQKKGGIRHCQLERWNGQQCDYSFRQGQGAAFAAHVLCVHIAHELKEKDT